MNYKRYNFTQIRKYTASIKLAPKNIAMAGTNEFMKVLKPIQA